MPPLIVCRVCGLEFTAPRWDARTCTPTCRSRLHRGGDLAYLAALTPKEQRAERAMHDARDAQIAVYREAVAATRSAISSVHDASSGPSGSANASSPR